MAARGWGFAAHGDLGTIWRTNRKEYENQLQLFGFVHVVAVLELRRPAAVLTPEAAQIPHRRVLAQTELCAWFEEGIV